MTKSSIRRFLARRFLASVALLAIVAGPAQASTATVTLCGSSICYEYDNTQSGLALFGTPTLVGDALRFLPTAFIASSVNVLDAALVSATFVIDRVYAVSGADLMTISVSEVGNYRTRNDGGISASLYLLAASNSIAKFTNTSTSVEILSPSYDLQPWNLSATLPIANDFMDFPGAGKDVALVIQNTLEAFGGGPSFTQKMAIFVNVTAVPIPATGFLLVPAFFALHRLARRRAAA